jgi:hypothetical protein
MKAIETRELSLAELARPAAINGNRPEEVRLDETALSASRDREHGVDRLVLGCFRGQRLATLCSREVDLDVCIMQVAPDHLSSSLLDHRGGRGANA